MPYKDPVMQALVTRTYRDIRKQEVARLKEAPCVDCGRRFPPECMQWDHRPGEVKYRAISRITSMPREALMAEIAKCDLVCANCHAIRTKARQPCKERLEALPGRRKAKPKAVRVSLPREPKTTCLRGHPYDEANTCISQGKRHCRTCNRMAQHARLA